MCICCRAGKQTGKALPQSMNGGRLRCSMAAAVLLLPGFGGQGTGAWLPSWLPLILILGNMLSEWGRPADFDSDSVRRDAFFDGDDYPDKNSCNKLPFVAYYEYGI